MTPMTPMTTRIQIFLTAMFAVIATLLAAIVAPWAFAGSTGALTLTGTVPATTTITVTPTGKEGTLDLGTSQKDLTVANVRETNNTLDGYTVTLTSQNAGKLNNDKYGAVAYTATYAGKAVTLDTKPTTITKTASTSTVTNTTKALAVSYTGTAAGEMMAGTYADTLTFTISAN